MVDIDAYQIPEIPGRIMTVTTEKDGRRVDVEVGVASDGAFVSFFLVEKPTAQAEPVLRNFVPSWSSVNEFLVHDEDAKGEFCRACRQSVSSS